MKEVKKINIKFNNGSEITSIHTDNNVRGIRNNFITCNCYDVETDDWIIKIIDMREPINRFVPEWCFDLYVESVRQEIIN